LHRCAIARLVRRLHTRVDATARPGGIARRAGPRISTTFGHVPLDAERRRSDSDDLGAKIVGPLPAAASPSGSRPGCARESIPYQS
jgi:hypothetical protein